MDIALIVAIFFPVVIIAEMMIMVIMNVLDAGMNMLKTMSRSIMKMDGMTIRQFVRLVEKSYHIARHAGLTITAPSVNQVIISNIIGGFWIMITRIALIGPGENY